MNKRIAEENAQSEPKRQALEKATPSVSHIAHEA